ncbi:bifunctional UDP-N-acetylglucosamine pyrophosphorylase/Glucosamine-1-phosphate N-acetyltransferase [Methylomarinovum caldicuralii]|uniref:Bifunctional protein GlmU n=1 Tax=Methylomarinovum caldicuralii TaxID=438856 RepID=A0AAU9C740_9GAMM|nr:bifunctional UDP-N-acetylglucosamine diphosphorylase/glucosamine-1-phosphate N-acetyltransferase GlmU [Methylomarinovum caldicuralii]BCX81201.1 bifunctional UDP-N-acetylglucosamine pyrophosphorylase/Glucosamine-1-phosphate N-acetyltransferase [Methylomarinovum caldicuralii]
MLNVVILAAGQGTRMRSDLPKVLHTIGGKPLLQHVYELAASLRPDSLTIVYGHGGEQVRRRFSAWPVHWVEQVRQLGTGHAVQQALPHLERGQVLILYGDVPLLRKPTLLRLLEAGAGGKLALLTVELEDPSGYGRIVRDSGTGQVLRIVEEKDATPEEKRIREVNTGILAVPAEALKVWLGRLNNDNAQGEYYLTDIIAMAVADGVPIETVGAEPDEVEGINNKRQLAELERVWQRRQAEALMDLGVTLRDPERFDVRGEVEAGRDVEIDPNVMLEGRIRLGDRVRIGMGAVIRDAEIGDDVEILPYSVIDGVRVGAGCRIGPFARLRPETVLADHVHIGNFVEIKKSSVGSGSKINHLSYVGDSEVGSGVNIGAGTITCNYDGVNKHRTVIGDGAFIGSDTQLVAPVQVGEGATIGAGSTITRDAPAGKLTLSRSKQVTVEHWQRPQKKS